MHTFFVHKWVGEPVESDEMAPKWYPKSELPYDSMWVDDKHWVPKVLDNEHIEAEFYFNGEGGEIDKFNIKELVIN